MNSNAPAAIAPGTARWHPDVVSCPDCCGDLAEEASSYWCSRCEMAVSYSRAMSDA
jgi:hypothetical protein